MNIRKHAQTTLVWEYTLITIGTLIMAFGIVVFLEPYTIAPGGVTGLAIVINKFTGIPIDIMNLAVNIPLFIIGWLVLGGRFGLKTAYGTLMLSLFLRITTNVLNNNMTILNDMLLASLYGGVLLGIGIGLVFKAGGTTGGTDLAGAILNHFIPSLSTAKLMMGIDLLIVVGAGVVNNSLETSLYSVISLYILVKIADFIVEGLNYAKAFFIISDQPEKVGQEILASLERGVTLLKARGMYTGNDRQVLLCIVDRTQVIRLKNIVYNIDNRAFIMVTTVHEVLGEGFSKQ